MTNLDRRSFLRTLGTSAAAIVLAPIATSCASETIAATDSTTITPPDPLAVPRSKPIGWDPIDFNRRRGHAGAIPASYYPQIDGPDGVTQHLGKHLPYVPTLDAGTVPSGMIALMWGDPSLGYARHPNAVPNESNQMHGHWYDWIEIRKATDGEAESRRSEYPAWPGDTTSSFRVFGGGDITGDGGKNTVYLAALPSDVRPGDLVRVHANCLTHGEYVDFLVVPG